MTSTTPFLSLRSAAAAALLGAATAFVPACGAQAADLRPAAAQSPTAPVSLRDWSLVITPYMWASSLKGDAAVRGYSANVDVPFSETLKQLQFGAMGAAELRRGNFGGYINAEYAKVASEKHFSRATLGVGMKNYLVSGGLYYRVFESQLGGNTVFGSPRVFAIEPTVGLRYARLTTKLRVGGFGVSASESWLDPFIGTRVTYDMSDRWNLALEGDVGGFGVGTRLSLNGQAAIGYRTTMLGLPTTFRAGYRVLHQDFRDGGFQWKVTQHGPIAGASIQF